MYTKAQQSWTCVNTKKNSIRFDNRFMKFSHQMNIFHQNKNASVFGGPVVHRQKNLPNLCRMMTEWSSCQILNDLHFLFQISEKKFAWWLNFIDLLSNLYGFFFVIHVQDCCVGCNN